MMRIHWLFSRFIERLGFVGYLVIAALLSLIVVFFFALQPAKQELKLLSTSNQGITKKNNQLSPEASLHQFVKRFPSSDARVEQISTVIDAAADAGLGLDNISYKLAQSQDDPLSHYHVDFNLVGNYEDVRQYLATLMMALPFASLDTLAMSRQEAEEDFIQTRVRLTLHFYDE